MKRLSVLLLLINAMVAYLGLTQPNWLFPAADSPGQTPSVQWPKITLVSELETPLPPLSPPPVPEPESLPEVPVAPVVLPPAEPEPPAPTTIAVQDQCWLLGPIADDERRQRVERLLQRIELDYQSESIDQPYLRHWVHIPPAASETAARQQLAQLRQRKVDSFLVQGGEYQNAISLGSFASAATAEQVLRRYQRQGLKVKLIQRTYYKQAQRYRLLVKDINRQAQSLARLWRLVAVDDPRKVISCDGIAQR